MEHPGLPGMAVSDDPVAGEPPPAAAHLSSFVQFRPARRVEGARRFGHTGGLPKHGRGRPCPRLNFRRLEMYEFAVTPAVTQLRRRGVTITEVEPGSLGAELELEAGDRVYKVNGRVVRDYLDFRFQAGGETELTLHVLKRGGEEWEVEVERAEGEDFGLSSRTSPRASAPTSASSASARGTRPTRARPSSSATRTCASPSSTATTRR